MPDPLSVEDFIRETKEDFSSPTTSTFVSKIPHCRNTVVQIEDSLECDREGLMKMKKALKQMHQNGTSHVESEVLLSKSLSKLGEGSGTQHELKDAFIKFSIVVKELSNLQKTLMQNLQNLLLFPLESLLKGDIKGVKGDLRRPFDKAYKDYEARHTKLEKEKKAQAKDAGMFRKEVTPGEIADETERERRLLQLNMCEYLLKANEIKTKKGVELLKHLVEYYHALNNYFQEGLKTVEHFGNYISVLTTGLSNARQKQDEERKKLNDTRNVLRSTSVLERELTNVGNASTASGYSLHQLQGNKSVGVTKIGYLNKKSEGKMRRVWQKRKCAVQDGFLQIFHGDEGKQPSKVNLLTCQLKVVSDDRKFFDLVSYNRTYHLNSDDEAEEWISVILNSKDAAMTKAFDQRVDNDGLVELTQAIINHIHRLPGNDRCADCDSEKEVTWLSVNLGVVVCIECSGVHRTLGVGVSRIQSFSLDRIPPSLLILSASLGNAVINQILEENIHLARDMKPSDSASMEERSDFIRAKYVDKKFVVPFYDRKDANKIWMDVESAIESDDLISLVKSWAQGAKLGNPSPYNELEDTPLHTAVLKCSLPVIDFLIQNAGATDKKNCEGNTPLHYCAMNRNSDAMKLLLRAVVDLQIQNNDKMSALDISRKRGYPEIEDLLLHAMEGKKTMFETVDFDWNLGAEDSTDFSDDDMVYPDDHSITPEKKRRPNSFFVESRESPYKSSNKFEKGPGASSLSSSSTFSLKNPRLKRVAPPPPPSPSSSSTHTRSPSDSLIGKLGRLVIPAGEPPALRKTGLCHTSGSSSVPSSVPISFSSSAQSQSNQVILHSPLVTSSSLPNGNSTKPNNLLDYSSCKKCKALYDCEADNVDEISFRQGDIIYVINENTEDDNWMEGIVHVGDEAQKGMFPVSFVDFLD